MRTGRIINSVKKTGRAIIAGSDCKTGGVGAEIASIIAEEAFDYLDASFHIDKLVCKMSRKGWLLSSKREESVLHTIWRHARF